MDINWLECELVEAVPGTLSGQPVIRGTRVRPEDLIVNRDQGEAWLARNHGLPVQAVHAVLDFHDRHARLRAPAA